MANSLRAYKLIAVAGLKDSGKTTAAQMLNYLLNAPNIFRNYWWYKIFKKWPFNHKWETTAFAKPLKQSLAVILNKPVEWFDNRKNKENYFVDLSTLNIYSKSVTQEGIQLSENKFQKYVKLGEPLPTEQLVSIRQMMQYYGTNVIRKYLGDKTWINATLNKVTHKNIIVSDLRFRVELNEIKQQKGVSVYILRDSAKPGTHASEREVVELNDENAFDYIVKNNGTLKDLFNNLKAII